MGWRPRGSLVLHCGLELAALPIFSQLTELFEEARFELGNFFIAAQAGSLAFGQLSERAQGFFDFSLGAWAHSQPLPFLFAQPRGGRDFFESIDCAFARESFSFEQRRDA